MRKAVIALTIAASIAASIAAWAPLAEAFTAAQSGASCNAIRAEINRKVDAVIKHNEASDPSGTNRIQLANEIAALTEQLTDCVTDE